MAGIIRCDIHRDFSPKWLHGFIIFLLLFLAVKGADKLYPVSVCFQPHRNLKVIFIAINLQLIYHFLLTIHLQVKFFTESNHSNLRRQDNNIIKAKKVHSSSLKVGPWKLNWKQKFQKCYTSDILYSLQIYFLSFKWMFAKKK